MLNRLIIFLGVLFSTVMLQAQTHLYGPGQLTVGGGGTLIIIADVRLLGPAVMHIDGKVECGGNWFTVPAALVTGAGEVVLNGDTLQEFYLGQVNMPRLTIDNPFGVALTGDLYLSDTLNLIQGNLFLGNYNLTMGPDAVILGADSSNFIVTNGTGMLIQEAPGARLYPLGASVESYHPAVVTQDSLSESIGIRVVDQVSGVTGESVGTLDSLVETTWIMEADSGANITKLSFIWNAEDVSPGFQAENCRVGTWTANGWELHAPSQANVLPNGQFCLDHISGTLRDSFIVTSGFGSQDALINSTGSLPLYLNEPEAAISRILCYPNPSSDLVWLEIEGEYLGQMELRLINSVGELSRSIRVDKEAFRLKVLVPVSRIPSGIYQIVLKTTEHACCPITGKLLVIHD